MSSLGEWIKLKYKSQAAFADALDVQQSRVSKWLSGVEAIPEAYQDRISGLKYKGPWPREETQEATAGGPYVTEAQFAEWRGYWRAGMEGVLERVKALEDQVRTLRQQAGLE